MPRRKKYIVGAKIRPNQSKLLSYGSILEKLINQIHRDIKKEIIPIYQEIDNGRVNDGFFSELIIAINGLIKKYSDPKETIEATKKFAFDNSNIVFKTYDDFKNQNKLRIDWKPSSNTRKVLDDAISKNIDLIKTIPRKYLEDVKKEFSKATAKGWDMQRINKVLTERHGITRRRAFNIAVDQQNKVINDVSNQTNKDAGLFLVQWIHRSGVRQPRHSHLLANGTVFDIRKGCFIDGEWIMPGEKINCHCFSVPIIPTEAQRRSASITSDASPFKSKILICRAA